MNETKRCPMCGEKILAVAKKCRFCGEYLEEAEKQPASWKNKIVATVAILIILGFAVAACFSLSENGSSALPEVIVFIVLATLAVNVFVIVQICKIAKNASKK